MSEEDAFVIAAFLLCIDLARDEASLKRWGREHAALIDAQSDQIFHPVRARFAERRAELNQGSAS